MTVVSNGQSYVVSTGTVVNNLLVLSGGSVIVQPLATANNTYISGGGYILTDGVTSGTVLASGSPLPGITFTEQDVISGGTAINTTVNQAGGIFVYSGGTAFGANLVTGSGGAFVADQVTVSRGGLAISTTVSAETGVFISSGGTSLHTQLLATGVQSSSFFFGGPEEVVSSGGLSISATVGSGSKEFVSSGGTAQHIVVNAGGMLSVASGGVASPNVNMTDVKTSQSETNFGSMYSGPVSGIQFQYVTATIDSTNIGVTTDSWFIHAGNTGSGNDAIAVVGGTNVVDAGEGSNFIVGGTGTDTFYDDDRNASVDIWDTVVNFHSGDAATFWGVTSAFNLNWANNQGAGGYTGLTLHATANGKPEASMTFASLTTADLSNGHLSTSFGQVDGNSYLYIKYN